MNNSTQLDKQSIIATRHHLTQKAKNTLDYPKLMASEDGIVVLFCMDRIGTVVFNPNNGWGESVGLHRLDWAMECFTDCSPDEYFTLQNVEEQKGETDD